MVSSCWSRRGGRNIARTCHSVRVYVFCLPCLLRRRLRIRRIVAGLLSWRRGFDPRHVRVEFVVNKLALIWLFLWVVIFIFPCKRPTRFIFPCKRPTRFIYHWSSMMSVTGIDCRQFAESLLPKLYKVIHYVMRNCNTYRNNKQDAAM